MKVSKRSRSGGQTNLTISPGQVAHIFNPWTQAEEADGSMPAWSREWAPEKPHLEKTKQQQQTSK